MKYTAYRQHLPFHPPLLYHRPVMPLPLQYHMPVYHVPGASIPAYHVPDVAIPAPAPAAAPASTVFIQRLMHRPVAVPLEDLTYTVLEDLTDTVLEDLTDTSPASNGVNLYAAGDGYTLDGGEREARTITVGICTKLYNKCTDDDDDIAACVFGVLGAQFCLTDPFTLASLGPRFIKDVSNNLCQKGREIPDGIPLFDPCNKNTNPIW